MLRWRSSVQLLRMFLVLLSTIRASTVFLHDAVQVSSATAVVACSSGLRSSKSKHGATKAETEAKLQESRPR